MAGKPPPSGGWGGVSAETEQRFALQSSLEDCGAHWLNPKNMKRMESKRQGGRVLNLKRSKPKAFY